MSSNEIDDNNLLKTYNLIKNSINESVDPCENFYEFSCGNWIANNKIPDDNYSYNLYRKLQNETDTKVKGNK